MRTIYNSTVVTIVAACGSNMEPGITGVDGNRQVQTVEEVQGLKLATVLVSLTNCNNKPQWNMRALPF